jgi:hypothetical protein
MNAIRSLEARGCELSELFALGKDYVFNVFSSEAASCGRAAASRRLGRGRRAIFSFCE